MLIVPGVIIHSPMMVGHSLLAFSVVTFFATRMGYTPRRSLLLGLLAASFAVLPDVDMAYAFLGLLEGGSGGVWGAVNSFWANSTVTHRGVTHSLVFAIPSALGFGYITHKHRSFRLISAFILSLLLVSVVFLQGLLPGVIFLFFVLGGVSVALAAKSLFLDVREVLSVALFGLVTHPFGDVFTGKPPAFLYPFDSSFLVKRVVLVSEPVLNLIVIFGIELLIIWVAVTVYGDIIDRSVVEALDTRVLFGGVYAVAVLLMPPPSLSMSYHFVFGVVCLGFVAAVPVRVNFWDWGELYRAFVLWLGVVSVALFAYTAAYLIL